VIQFEEQRFLIGSSPASVTLLSRLPDASPGSSEARGNAGENN
jgi:flagellar biogenesis protein FliO